MTFTIEKEIPMPARGRGAKYPLATMECGDSFFIPTPDKETEDRYRSLAANWHNYRPKKFTSRKIKEDGVVTGIRVWRIE